MSPNKRHDVVREMQPEYNFSGGVRGKYYQRYRDGAKVRLITDDATEEVAFVFADDGPVDAALLGDLLFLLRGAYAAGIRAMSAARSGKRRGSVAKSLENYLRRLDIAGLNELFTCDLGDASLVTTSVSYQSPLRMRLRGSSEGLDAAIALAGEARAIQAPGTSEWVMAPVGVVTRLLRDALVTSVGAPVGYGVRSRRLKLSKTELRELLRHDPSTKNRGGFQRFLIGLQSRVNRTSGELDLSDTEMAMILKHGRNPSRGGWQASIRKIFGSHFEFDAE